jgi:predicted dehydrogenase
MTSLPRGDRSRSLVLAQLGCGYWGPNLLRNFSALPGCEVRYVVDESPERRAFVQRNFPRTTAVASADVAFDDREVAGIIVATPAGTHFTLARQALEAGKHIMVEKPLATTVAEVDILARYAQQRGLVVMAGHTFIYNAAVRYVKRLIDSGELGDVRYVYSQRLNLGRIRSDIDAMWNFAPHDASIVYYWLGRLPTAVACRAYTYLQQGVPDVAFLTLEFDDVVVHVHVSWLSPSKVRKMTLVGSRRMLVYDDVAADKILIYDSGIDRQHLDRSFGDFHSFGEFQLIQRQGDVLIPRLPRVEPLMAQCDHFLECIRHGREPITGWEHGATVVALLEAASASFAAGGETVVMDGVRAPAG